MSKQMLEPCPFCGPGQSQVSLWFDDMSKRWRVGCGRCGCSTGTSPRDKTEAPAIKAWNTRPHCSAVSAEPVAWKYEYARARDYILGEPATWSDWTCGLSISKPNMPEGAIRNLVPLYARTGPQATSIESEASHDPCCPFCGRDPFHYVDNGIGMEAVAVTCCELGDDFFRGQRSDPETVTMSWDDFRKIGHRLAERRCQAESDKSEIRKVLDNIGKNAVSPEMRAALTRPLHSPAENIEDCQS